MTNSQASAAVAPVTGLWLRCVVGGTLLLLPAPGAVINRPIGFAGDC